jgi:hypothetical protein
MPNSMASIRGLAAISRVWAQRAPSSCLAGPAVGVRWVSACSLLRAVKVNSCEQKAHSPPLSLLVRWLCAGCGTPACPSVLTRHMCVFAASDQAHHNLASGENGENPRVVPPPSPAEKMDTQIKKVRLWFPVGPLWVVWYFWRVFQGTLLPCG